MPSHVVLVRCADYDPGWVEAAVRRAVDLLGGMRRFVQPGQRVLIKPNLLQASDPDRAVITHPSLVRAAVLLAQEAGGQVLIADNPCLVPVNQRGWHSLYDRAGLAAVASETGAALNTRIVAEQRPHPEGHLLKLVDTSSFVTESDVCINLPKLKTHNLMRFTGAVKNLFGTVPAATKFGYHVKLQDVGRFADMLLDLVSFVRPSLSIMDAVVGMDGDGPSGGEPFPIGAILAAPDAVALDVAALALVGHAPGSVPTVAAAMRRGWTTGDPGSLAWLGAEGVPEPERGFRMPPGGPRVMPKLPSFLDSLATRQMVASPMVTARCSNCGQCVQACPVQTIVERDRRASIQLSRCIRCYCCHELCPEHAVILRRPWASRLLARFGW